MRILTAVLAVGFALAIPGVCAQETYTSSGKINALALFEKGMNALSGAGFSRSDADAMNNFRAAADLGFAPAQVVMGYFADTGSVREPQAALDWYKKAAEQDDALGQWLLGRLYFLKGDMTNARRWLSAPADAGNPFAQYLLGRVLEDRDYTQAPEWFRKAAEQGLPQAQARLGIVTRDGRGIKRDKFEAYVWLLMSFEAGNRSVESDLRLAEGDLGSTELDKAKAKARDWETTMSRDVVARGCTGWAGEFDEVPAPPPPPIQRFCR
jgi:TPR repeat protein